MRTGRPRGTPSHARRRDAGEATIREALRAEVARAGSQAALAVEWGLSRRFVGQVLNGRDRPTATVRERLGFGPRPATRSRFDAAEAIRLRREGHTYREIGAALGVSNQAVRERLVGLGVDIPFNPPSPRGSDSPASR